MVKGWPLDYWDSQEWRDVNGKLDLLDSNGVLYNPGRGDLFRALELCSLAECRVAICLQDPYPNPIYATGVGASAARKGETPFWSAPPTLRTIYAGYKADLGYPEPTTISLESWCEQGVLLWNVTPTIEIDWNEVDNTWDTWTHQYWPEWPPLTQEIIERLSAKGRMVFAFLGARAHAYAKYVETRDRYNSVMCLAHPSPRGQSHASGKFVDSRFFSTISDHLSFHMQGRIDWRLP